MANDSEPQHPAESRQSVLSAEASPPHAGWLPPAPAENRRNWQTPLAIGCVLAAALFLAGPLIFLAIYNLSSAGSPSVQAVEFGRGGSGCTVTMTGDRFPHGTPVRIVANFSPAIPAGSSVLIKLHRDGTELTSRREILRIDEASDCIYAEQEDLAAGRYRIVYELESSAMSPLSGEFEVTAE